jgi:hypothetical protein
MRVLVCHPRKLQPRKRDQQQCQHHLAAVAESVSEAMVSEHESAIIARPSKMSDSCMKVITLVVKIRNSSC